MVRFFRGLAKAFIFGVFLKRRHVQSICQKVIRSKSRDWKAKRCDSIFFIFTGFLMPVVRLITSSTTEDHKVKMIKSPSFLYQWERLAHY